VKREYFPAIIEKAMASSSMTGNPVVLSDEELHGILEQAL
jgi:alcohol dehydrogenase class IV